MFKVSGDPMQYTCAVTAQPRESFSFLGHTWLKVLEHDLELTELTELYGNWRQPDPGWSYLRDGACLSSEPGW